MAYIINDKNLIKEICKFKSLIEDEQKRLVNTEYKQFVHPLDDDIIGTQGKLSQLHKDSSGLFLYSAAKDLDELWRMLLDKSIRCLRYFDNREPFQENNQKAIVAYGIDNLEE